MKRYPNDDARKEKITQDVWPEGKTPLFQEHQCKPYIEWHFPKERKTNAIQIPDGMLILREDDPRLSEHWPDSVDTPYFKLIHPMKGIETADLPLGVRFICPDDALLSGRSSFCCDSRRMRSSSLSRSSPAWG